VKELAFFLKQNIINKQPFYFIFVSSVFIIVLGVINMHYEKCIIVEGRSDMMKLAPIFAEEVKIVCTNGTISEDALLELLEPYEECELYTFFDADQSGDKFRKLMKRIYSEATHLNVPKTYMEMANAPRKVLAQLLKEAKFSVHKEYLV